MIEIPLSLYMSAIAGSNINGPCYGFPPNLVNKPLNKNMRASILMGLPLALLAGCGWQRFWT